MPQTRPKTISSYLLLSTIALLLVFPVVWLFSTALKSPDENIFRILERPTLHNFIKVWISVPFPRYLWNSLVVASLTVLANLILSALAAYPLARWSFRGRGIIFWAIIGTMMIPFQVTLIPLYILAVKLGLKNTYLGLIFPYGVSAFGIFLLRQAFITVPKELEEAAIMDGCHPLDQWFSVMLPAISPALITLSIFTFVSSWGDFLWALLIIDKPDLYTLPLGVATLESAFSQDWRLVAAGSVISILPILILFIWAQKYIIPSNVGTGIKG
jgi:putative chitobiose transport system permease protein